ncbi:unnamed protein product [Orchesella dallaii]|uniref:Helicase ATP-binding domain-containing protein n=1 Tax=Orchesella dallaii TaxID=48710 RepID=A0ABP1R6A3_9HEXA
MDQTQATQATQGGPGTGPFVTTISGVRVEFPCKPYPSQMAMMSKVITGLKQRKNCLLESPTGSGKSLALLCSALAWQRHEAARVFKLNEEMEAQHLAAKQAQAKDRREKVLEQMKKQKQQLEEQNRSLVDESVFESNVSRDIIKQEPGSSLDISVETSSIPVYDITDDEDEDDFKPAKRTRISKSSSTSIMMNKSGNDALNSNTENLQGNTEIKKGTQADLETDSPYFVPPIKELTVPKIIFGTRTHKQIAQITRELRKTKYANVRSIVLASRDHTCINPAVNKLPNKNEACRELVQNAQRNGGCQFHGRSKNLANFQALASVGLQPAYDLEDLVAVGRRTKACPYYVTRYLMQTADIIFCPYNYMIDPSIRKSMSMDLDGHILIFDEAHNMEDAARESSSFSLKQDELQRCMQDCEKVAKCGTEPYAHEEIAKLISTLSQWMDMQTPQLREKSFNSSGKCWNGTDFLGSVHASGMTQEGIALHQTYFEAIIVQRDQQMEAVRERGNRWYEEKPLITTQSVGVIESIFRLFTELTRENGRYRDDFRVAMSKDNVRQRANGNSGPFRSVQVLSLHLWCLNPAVAFEDIQKQVHSIVLTSGTLSPMQSFESELGAPFPLRLEASHVIDKNQVWAGVIGTGPNGVSLNGSYQNTETLKYQDELGEILYRICNTMPHGVLCFFPSYRMLDTLCNRWTETNVLARIEQDKIIVKEPRSGPDMFQEAMDNFYGAVAESTRNSGSFTCTGALFFAVYRGKVSEGLDFADNNARAVICIGIPFPNVRDMQVELKRDYNTRNMSRGLLGGGEWYEIQAFRALNQALGRCIRHRKDWGAIFLIDDRYLRTPRYLNSLSKWIRSSVMKIICLSSYYAGCSHNL